MFLLAAIMAAATGARAAPPLEAYGRLPAIQSVALSPSGDRFAVLIADKDGRKVIVRTSTGEPVAALGFGAAKVRSIEFAGEDHVLILETATVAEPWVGAQDFEYLGVVDLNLKTRASYMIFNKSNTFLDIVFGWHGARQVGGRWYAYVGGIRYDKQGSAREQATFPDLYRVDLETGKPELVAASAQRARGWLIGADGQIIANSVYERDQRQWTVYAGPGTDRPILRRAGEQALSFVSEGRRPGTVLVSERINETTDLRELRADGQGEGEVLVADEIAAHPVFDRDTGLVVGLSDANGETTLFDPASQKRIDDAHRPFADERAVLVSHSRDFRQLIFRTSGPKDAGRYWLIDTVARSAVPIGDIWPEIAPADVGPVRMFAYKAADGLALDGVLTLPVGREARNLALVVLPHGGPINPGSRVEFNWWAQAFASRGYAVFQPNYRGTEGFGDARRKAADGELNRKMQTDISDGVGALATAGIADPRRVCIVGEGYAGYMALAGVTLQHGLYRCAVSVGGVTDVTRWLIWKRDRDSVTSSQRQEAFWRLLSGNPTGDIDPASPLKSAAKADAPIQLVHGDKDTSTPIEQSRLMQKALASAGKSVEFVTPEGDDHALANAPARQAMLNAVVAFVQKNNPAN